jgi:ABC-type nitrate/sulfonate/bicarbonate transport system permease component
MAHLGPGGGHGVTLLRRAGLFAALPVLLLLTWWLASADSTDFYQPPLRTILAALPATWQTLLGELTVSLPRLLAGYALALAVGIAVGVLIGSIRWLRAVTEPVLEFLRAVPPPVLVPIITLMAGIGDLTKVLVIFSGCVWPILLNTVEGVRAIDEVLTDTCRSYRVRGGLRLRRLVLRSASPQIMTGARQALAIAIILMVISELFASSDGVGYTIVQFQRGFQIPEMWAGVFFLGLLGITLSLIFWLVERRVLAWYHGVRAAERGTQ